MAKEKEYLEDIAAIRSIMERSSQFISLSGMAGVMAGIYALVGSFAAYKIIYSSDHVLYDDIRQYYLSPGVVQLIGIAAFVLLASIVTAFLLSKRKAKRDGRKFPDAIAIRLALNFLIPLVTGGLFVGIMVLKGNFSVIAPATLIFYGLALVQASKYTFKDVKVLGMAEISIGLLAAWLHGYALWFWAVGFGLLHIVYGIFMYLKYEK